MLPENRALVRASGVQRTLQPESYGGHGGPLRAMVERLTEIGSACGSAGWAVAQYILHNYMVSQWPPEAHEMVWGEDPDALVSGILVPSLGHYERADGGYRVTGRWPWVTGVDTCDWCIVAAYEKDNPGHDGHRHFLFKREQLTIVDTWHAIGLRGSGTNDIDLQEVFVPEPLACTMEDLRGGESPGGHWRANKLYLLPSYAIFGLGITSGAVGIAREVARHHRDTVRSMGSVMSEKAVSGFASQQIRFAEAFGAIDSAYFLLLSAADEIARIALEEGRAPTSEERARCRALATVAGNTAMDGAKTVWDLSGAISVYERSVMSGLYTDMIVANQHFTQNKDPNFRSYGLTLFGHEIDNPTL